MAILGKKENLSEPWQTPRPHAILAASGLDPPRVTEPEADLMLCAGPGTLLRAGRAGRAEPWEPLRPGTAPSSGQSCP